MKTDCPYVDWEWTDMRLRCGMTEADVRRTWHERRNAAIAAGYRTPDKARERKKWLASGIDNPFQSEDAFRIRLAMALKRGGRKEAAA